MPTTEQKIAYCKERNVVPTHHCCVEMAFNLAHPILTPHQGRNRVINWIAATNEYYIPVAHDGYAATIINYCPWCGSLLGESKNQEWYQRLYDLGYTDPGNDDLPKEFQTDKWWRKK
jgi:hypothetical protein